MKIRTGFVSNSSSSSFCIYGKCIDSDELIEIVKRNKPEEFDEYIKEYKIEYDEEEQCYSSIDDYDMADILGLSYDNMDGDIYIGKSWSDIGDNETGKEFKESVEKILGEGCGTHEETYYS